MTLRAKAAWFLALALALGAGLAVWRLAPIGADDLRLVAAATPVVLWAIALLALGSGTPRANAAASADEPDPFASRAPSDRWGRSIADALRARRLSGRGQRYRVPLYLVVGPPGSGKSTILERSQLDIDAPTEVGGARWWISSDAIFVEMSPGMGVDQEVLKSLKRFRPAMPVTGVLLVVSPADLTLADAQERRETGDAIARLVTGAQTLAEARVPVYVLLSKLDLTPGFSEFFDRMEAHERQQLWGFSLPAEFGGRETSTEALEALRGGIRRLVNGTRLRLVEWLSRESDARRGGRILTFGAQVAALDPIVDSVLKPLLPSEIRKTRGAHLRGVYLTSARQDALSIDPLLPELAERYRMPRSGLDAPDLSLAEEEENYFVGGTLRKAVLSEAGLTRRAPRRWHRRPVVGATAVAASLALLALSIGPVVASFEEWNAALEAPASRSAELGPVLRSSDPADLERILLDVEALAEIEIASPVNAYPRSGLRVDRVREASREAYDRALRYSLLPHLLVRLEADLVDLEATPEELRLRQAVAVPSAARSSAAAEWLRTLSDRIADGQAADALLVHGARALALTPPASVGPDYLDASRALLAYREARP